MSFEAAVAVLAGGAARLSLAPGREAARSLATVARCLAAEAGNADGEVVAAWAEGLRALSRTVDESFPENLFFDTEALAGALLAAGVAGGVAPVAEAVTVLVELHRLFGCATTIRFRYVHDFLYGFDWAKWVQRCPEERAGVGPFDLPFLVAMRARGAELLALIEANDDTYPRLRGPGHRNPFGFSREPEDEARLFRALAEHDELPVPAFAFQGPWRWQRPYAELRERRAASLGLGPHPCPRQGDAQADGRQHGCASEEQSGDQ